MSETSVKPQRTPIQLSADVAKAVELDAIALRSWTAKFNSEEPGLPKLPGPLEVAAGHKSSYRLDPERRRLDVEIRFNVSGKSKADESGTEVLSVKCTLVLRYSAAEPLDVSAEQLHHFTDLNALVNAWPYFRELVHDTTTRMGIPPFFLPLLRLPRTAPKTK